MSELNAFAFMIEYKQKKGEMDLHRENKIRLLSVSLVASVFLVQV